MTTQPEALRLAENLTAPRALRTATAVDAAAELLRLHDENETLRKQRDEIFTALVQISLLTHLGGEVAEYGDVVEAVRRLHAVNAELLEALKRIDEMCAAPPNFSDATMQEIARAAIARAEGEQT
jgi:hypothetical protein